MSAADNKTIFHDWLKQVLNRRDLSDFDQFVAPDLIEHFLPPGLPPGREGTKLSLGQFFQGFPDLHFKPEDVIAEGDKVVARLSVTGTQRGQFMGMPPTGKPIHISMIEIMRFTNGKMAEHWSEMDQMGLMQQLGMIPTPGQA